MAAATMPRALEIRPLDLDEPPRTFAALARLTVDAYPIMHVTSEEEIAKLAARFETDANQAQTRWVVAEHDGVLTGAMRLYDYTMNVRGRDAFTGGVGSVAVARDHKRQGIARALIGWYLDHYGERGAAFAILHPFRFDFYRALGFGYGTPVHRYRFATATLRDQGARGTIRSVGIADAEAVEACYERVRARTNGLATVHRSRLERMLGDAALRYVAVDDEGEIRGFMQTSVVNASDDLLRNRDELLVRDLIAEAPAYRAALAGYLRSQRDQFARVMIESQDETLYLMSDDPRDGSDESVAPPAGHRIARTGLGMMYRILDVEPAFAHLPASPVPFTLRAEIEDAFFAPTGGAWTFRFGPHGAPQVARAADADATLRIGIADLSSALVGSLRLRDLVRNGLASIEPRAMLDTVDDAFRADEPPVCITRF